MRSIRSTSEVPAWASRLLSACAIFALAYSILPLSQACRASDSGPLQIPAGFLSTRGNQIIDSHGKPVRIACVGGLGSAYAGGHLDYKCGPYKTLDENMAAVKRLGFNCIRADFSNNNLKDVGIMSEFDQLVAGCKKYGLKVILCHHNDEATSANWSNVAQQSNGLWYDLGPGTNGTDGGGDIGTVTKEKFLEDWVTVAKRYRGNDTVIGFDLDNEPCMTNDNKLNWGEGGPTDIWAMYTSVGNAIQAVDPGALVICEGPIYILDKSSTLWLSMDLTQVATKPVVLHIPHKVVYSVHEYPKEISAVTYDQGPGLVARMNRGWGYLEARNIAPVWIGEMGMPSNSGDTDANAFEATIIPYLNGQNGSQGGPTFHGNQQPISTDTWRWGCQPETGDGCMNPAGEMRSEVAGTVDALLFKAR